MGTGRLCHGEEGVRDVREEGIQVKVLPTPWLLFLIPKQHGHHVAEELVAPFLHWLPEIFILHEMERRSRVGRVHGWLPSCAPWQLPCSLQHLSLQSFTPGTLMLPEV